MRLTAHSQRPLNLSECLVSLSASDCLARIRSWMRDSRAYLGASWAGPPVTSAQQGVHETTEGTTSGRGWIRDSRAIGEYLGATLERVGLAAVDHGSAGSQASTSF